MLTEKVVALEIDTKIARGEKTAVSYDYLLIATGINGKARIEGAEENTATAMTAPKKIPKPKPSKVSSAVCRVWPQMMARNSTRAVKIVLGAGKNRSEIKPALTYASQKPISPAKIKNAGK